MDRIAQFALIAGFVFLVWRKVASRVTFARGFGSEVAVEVDEILRQARAAPLAEGKTEAEVANDIARDRGDKVVAVSLYQRMNGTTLLASKRAVDVLWAQRGESQ
jgi:hypothetical protein